jgi:hypothetical protein
MCPCIEYARYIRVATYGTKSRKLIGLVALYNEFHFLLASCSHGSLSRHILIVCSACSGRDAIHSKRPRNIGVNFRAVQVGEIGVVFFLICFILHVGRHSRLAVFVSSTRRPSSTHQTLCKLVIQL